MRDVYGLTDEQRLEASKTTIKPTAPTTGIMTGYLIYHGHYVPPPYQVTKVKTDPITWAVQVNGLTCETRMASPDVWRPELPADGQFQRLLLIEFYCRDLWRKGEAAVKTYDQLKADIEDFLRTQKYVVSFQWVGKYVVDAISRDSGTPLLVKAPRYPPGEQLIHWREIHHWLFDVLNQLHTTGRVRSVAEAEPFVIEALMEQEAAAGPPTLSPGLRREKAREYLGMDLAVGRPGFSFEWPPGSPKPAASAEADAERERRRVEQKLAGSGVVGVGIPGYRVTGRHDYERIQTLINILEARVPIDVKVSSCQRCLGTAETALAWTVVANFRLTPELRQRLAADVERTRGQEVGPYRVR